MIDVQKLRELLQTAKADGVLHMRNRKLRFDSADGSFSQFDESGHMESVAFADTAACPTCVARIDIAEADAALICAAVNALPELLRVYEASIELRQRESSPVPGESIADLHANAPAAQRQTQIALTKWRSAVDAARKAGT